MCEERADRNTRTLSISCKRRGTCLRTATQNDNRRRQTIHRSSNSNMFHRIVNCFSFWRVDSNDISTEIQHSKAVFPRPSFARAAEPDFVCSKEVPLRVRTVKLDKTGESSKSTRSPASYCLNNDVSVWVARPLPS